MSISEIKVLIAEATPQLKGARSLRNGDVVLTEHPLDKDILIAAVYANGIFLTTQAEEGYVALEVDKDENIIYYVLGRQELWKRYVKKPQGFADVCKTALTKTLRQIDPIRLENVFFNEDIELADCLIKEGKGYVTISLPSEEADSNGEDPDEESLEPVTSLQPVALRVRLIRF